MAPGSVGRSLFEAEERGEIPPDSTTMLIWNYIGPAFDTTIDGIGSTVWLLARDPEQWKLLKDEPALIPAAFNEGLRMETPISIWARGCRGGAEIDGVTIPSGSRMCVLLASANRDERHYPDPDHYDVRRDPHDQCRLRPRHPLLRRLVAGPHRGARSAHRAGEPGDDAGMRRARPQAAQHHPGPARPPDDGQLRGD